VTATVQPGSGAPSACPSPAARVRSGAARVAAPVGVALVAVTGAALLGAVNPHQPGHYPTCPFLWLTGLYCPGCGSLRAVHDLVHLDLAGAWSMNPFLVLVLPALLAAWVAWLRRAATGAARRRVLPAWTIWTILALVLAYWVARNVPALAPWLAP